MTKRLMGTGLMAAVLFTWNTSAMITLPKILGNNMVLQQHKPVPVWGNAAAGEQITVQFNKQVKNTTADAEGHWKIYLDPLTASSSPAPLTISGSNTITLSNILVGEVWLCSGQSNMEYTMRKNSKVVKTDSSKNSPIDELHRAKNPAIRIFLVSSKNLKAPDSTHSGWSLARDSALRSFSAAGYFFAKELYSKLHVPIGVISSAVPGSAIEPWLPETISASVQNNSVQAVKIDAALPGKFFPAMVNPLAPFALKGFLWYQGETNCFQNESAAYTMKMQLLVNGWRKLWNDTLLPFYYVAIAPYYYSKSAGKYPLTPETLPAFWEAQTLVLHLPHTGMAVITDLVASPDDLHPGFKWEVGRRLAQWPLAKDYGRKVVPSGPMFNGMKKLAGKIEIAFSYTGQGLASKDGKPLNWFTIAGSDGKFVPAEAVLKGDKVLVSSPSVPRPEQVRFAWNEAAQPNLFNRDGLPAIPFRTDRSLQFEEKWNMLTSDSNN